MLRALSLRVHLPAIILAVLFGALIAGQFFVAADKISGVFPELADDQNFYLSRIQDFRDGATMSGNTYLLEQKTAPPMNYLTGEGVEAFILNALNLPTQEALLLFPLLLTPIIFILTYAIFIELRTPRFYALAGTALLLFLHFEMFARPISPQFNFIFWLLAIWGMIAMTNRPSWRSVVLESLAIGFLFYLYPYYWTHILAAFGVLFIAYLFINRKSAWSFFGITLGSIAVGAGALLLLWENRLQPFYTESMQRLGFIGTHFPSGFVLLGIGITALLAAGFLAWKNKYDWRLLSTGSLVLGGMIAMNQHLVTGLNMEFSSHYILQIEFASLFLIGAALGTGDWWKKLESVWVRGFLAILLSALLLPAIWNAYTSADQLSDNGTAYNEYSALTTWLKKNTEPESVVYAPEAESIFIPAYTKDNVFYARNGNIGFMSEDEVIDRFIIQNFRANIDDAFIENHEREIFGHYYFNLHAHELQKQKLLGFFGIGSAVAEQIPQDSKNQVEERAKQLQSLSFTDAAKPYEINYVLVDGMRNDQLSAKDLAGATLVFETARFKVYKR